MTTPLTQNSFKRTEYKQAAVFKCTTKNPKGQDKREATQSD